MTRYLAQCWLKNNAARENQFKAEVKMPSYAVIHFSETSYKNATVHGV